MQMEKLDIDSFIDYRAEYTSVIKKAQISGDSLTGLCPFHNDSNSSFSADLKTGQWYCFAEGEGGNFIGFVAKLNNIDNAAAYKQILEKYGKKQETGEKAYTISQYAFSKRLPEDWLKERFKLENAKTRDGKTYIKMPYFNEKGELMTNRHRFFNKEFKWAYGSKGKICFYNLQSLTDMRNVGYVILCEGESDTQTLTYLTFPALGVPGAAFFKAEWADFLQDMKVYIHKEPDAGGDTFFNKVRENLRKGGFIGECYVFGCGKYDAKDPSELYLKNGAEKATKLIGKMLKNAESVDLTEEIPKVLPEQPLALKQPEKWVFSDKGISVIGKEGLPALVCRTPIIITKRLKGIETGEEKVEVSFYRDKKWHTASFPRSVIFTARGITALADLGCTVTSENAKQLVRYLSALEAENIDIIPLLSAVNTFGWHGKNFVPYHSGELVLDIDPSQRNLAAAYSRSGDYSVWLDMMRPHRERNKFRFILASSFAAPLLKILKQRIFFVYNWGGSKGGKTAALKAALSVWGDPERLMVSFNATQVGLERTAAFYCDLPLGIDERQLVGGGDKAQNGLEKIVYMLSAGQGRIRGSKSGGLRHTDKWRTIAIATGEEPLSADNTQTGVSTRTIEIYGAPFEDEASASRMHKETAEHYGFAGNMFIERILDCDQAELCELYEKMSEHIARKADGKSGSHIAGIAAAALADVLAQHWIFDNCVGLEIPDKTWQRAEQMAETVLAQQLAAADADVNENARQYIVDWIMSNQSYFGSKAVNTCYGFLDGDKAYIFPSLLNDVLKKGGFSPRKTLKALAEKGVITANSNGNHTTYSVMKHFIDRSCRFVEFFLKDAEFKDPLFEAEFVENEDELPF